MLERGFERAIDVLERARQFDGVFQRELGPRADREVRGVGRIAHQHHRHALAVDLVPVHPALADHARELDPDRGAAQVRGVADERVAVQVGGEKFFAVGDAFFLRHLVDAGRFPRRFRRLDDERGGAVLEAVGVRLEPAMLGGHEDEVEGVEHLLRAEPHEAALARVDVRAEGLGVALAHQAVEAVGGQHQVGAVFAGDCLIVFDILLEHELDAHFLAAGLEDVEQLLAADPDEAVAAAAHRFALEVHLDVVPAVEGVADRRAGNGVGLPQIAHGGIGEHDAPAEGVIGAVALDDHDVVGRVLQLHQQPKIEAGGAAAEADDFHDALLVALRGAAVRACRRACGISMARCVVSEVDTTT